MRKSLTFCRARPRLHTLKGRRTERIDELEVGPKDDDGEWGGDDEVERYLEEIHKAEIDALVAHTATIMENGGIQELADTIMKEEIARMETEFASPQRES